VPLRAVDQGAGILRLDYAITRDGELLAGIAPTYEVLRRSTGEVVAAGPLLPEAAPELYSAVASVGALPAADLRARSRFSYLGLVVAEEAAVLSFALPGVFEIEHQAELAEVSALEPTVAVSVAEEVVDVEDERPALEVLDLTEQPEVISL
jgi:hypothetical protein